MTPMQQTLAGIAVFAATASGAVISIQAITPVTRATSSATTAAPPSHSCADMNGKRFGWSWSNAPFASSCDVRPDEK